MNSRATGIPDHFRWLNEPEHWSDDAGTLSLVTDDRTDFWQTTFYGFKRDNGHALLRPVSGDFSASALVRADYAQLYDQAGLMLHVNETTWVKTGIEYTDGLMHFSVVVTRDVSDWSIIPLHGVRRDAELAVRLTRHADAIRVQYAIDGGGWQMARLSPFPALDAEVGVMACSPERAGLHAQFRDIVVGPPIERKLHD